MEKRASVITQACGAVYVRAVVRGLGALKRSNGACLEWLVRRGEPCKTLGRHRRLQQISGSRGRNHELQHLPPHVRVQIAHKPLTLLSLIHVFWCF